jgi:hypothetical protein
VVHGLAVRFILSFRAKRFPGLIYLLALKGRKRGEEEMASSHCFKNAPALNPAGGGGEVIVDFGGQKAYITGSPESKAAVIFISDAFGKGLP